MIYRIDVNDFDRMYEIMDQSFPQDEYRPYEEQKALFEIPEYQVYVSADEEQKIKGFFAVWEFEEFVFAEHFAVDPECRNGGIGKDLLNTVVNSFDKMVCLEVELPDNELASRRIAFYERNGFHFNDYPYMQPSISEGRNPIPLRIMTSGKKVTEEEYIMIKTILYERVYHVKDEPIIIP